MRRALAVLVLMAVGAAATTDARQQPPSPQPFPRSGGGPAPAAPPSAPPPSAPAPARGGAPAQGARPGAPSDTTLGVPGIIFPQAEYLDAFDLGRAQRCYIFGTNSAFPDVVAYYKQALKDGGRELFKAPAMQQFDIGKFQEQTMTTQPSVVVKDYSFGDGYLQIDGTKATRFKTVIQIVPAPGR